MKKYFSGKFLDEIDTDLIDKVKYIRLEHIYGSSSDGNEYKTSPQTVNKMLAILHAVFIKARDEWMWIQSIPKINSLEVRKDRGRHFVWLTKEEAKAVLNELPPHLHAMMKFTLATGLRESNVTKLCWSQIDLEQGIALVDSIHSKNSCTIEVPLNDDAKKVLASQKGLHSKYVFSYKGNPIKKANHKAWRCALDRAGIRAYFPSKTSNKSIISKYPTKELYEYKYPTFRWHDLRHTWASWHVQNRTPLAVLQKLGGWNSYEMVLRYAHFARSHIAEHANNISLEDLD